MSKHVRPGLLCAVAFLMVLGTATIVGAAVPEPPYETNVACLECHNVALDGPAFSKVDFSVPGAVDYNRCKTCHLYLPDRKVFPGGFTYLEHYHGLFDDCMECHAPGAHDEPFFTFPAGSPRSGNLVSTPYGYFAGQGSLNASPETLHGVHMNPGWVEATFGDQYAVGCSRCHAPASCSACHTDAISHGDHALPDYPGLMLKQADGLTATTSRSTCVDPACHSVLVAGTPAFNEPSCLGCHTVDIYGGDHGYDSVNHVAADGEDNGIACSSCHDLDLATEHNKATSSSAGQNCSTCHPSPRDSLGAWDQGCVTGGCHTLGSSAPYHANVEDAHAVVEAGELCLECHAGTDLATVHSEAEDGAGATSCLVCHGTSAPTTSDCTVCHFTFEGHYDEAAHLSQWTLDSCGDAGCHSTRDLMGAHVEKNAQFDCFGCHGSTDPVVVAAIDTGATACGSCHPGVSESTGHRTAHWANPMLIGATGPNYSYWTGTMGGAPSTDCAGCHTSNLIDEHMGYVDPDTGFALIQPRYDSSGASLDCGTCHGASASVEVQLAITMGDTRCDACHSVHGPIGVIHQTSYKVDPEVDCSGCHSRDLTVVHNGVMTATTPSGRVLSGCSICHSYWEGETGALVEAAIAANNTDCTACHPTYHGDSSSHVAVSSESLDCGRCHGPVVEGELRVEPVHAEATLGACAVCHANAARVPDISAKTAECASCHAIAGTEYHRAADDKHTFGSMDPGCVAAGCHASNMLPAAHEPYLARYPQYTDTCALCHLNEDVSRIDWSTASADCSTCHEVHGDIEQIHQAPGSTECTACHSEGPDVRLLHGASPEASCAVCHNSTVDTSGTAACVNCHDYSPVAQKHYDASDHTAVEVPGCSNCHYLELKPEHDKPTSGPVGCVSCHTSPWFPDTWNKSCMGCHEVRHTDVGTAHTSASDGCGGAGCHAVHDVSIIHAGLPSGGCSACHAQGVVPVSTSCDDCHSVYHNGLPAKHEASQSASVGDCGRCHGLPTDGRVNIEPIHAAATLGACAVCHANAARVPDISAKTAECASCHAIAGAEYHRAADDKHTFGSMDPGCVAAGCHASNMLPAAHEPYLARYPQYTDTCALCHLNEDVSRIDWSTASADCSTCHEVHGDIEQIHQAPGSTECTACHTEGPDVRLLHGASPEASCAVCHNSTVDTSGTAACVNCHDYSPVAQKHYDASDHTAVEVPGCSNCHYLELKPEHDKPTSGPVGCVSCHTSPWFPDTWNKSCMGCHEVRHGAQNQKHISNRTSCGGTGCHAIQDVSLVHADVGSDGGCSVCHAGPDAPAQTTDCSAAGCHAGVGTNHHEAHDGRAANGKGCEGCHFRYLDDEHAAFGLTCATCHASAVPTVKAAIAAGDRRCLTCHPDSPHNVRQGAEFAPGNASMHRVRPDLPGMRSSFLVNGSTYTMSLPSASTFLRSGYGYDTVVECDSCHTYSGAQGPHGAAMKINMDPAYPNPYRVVTGAESNTAQLSKNSPTGMSMTKGGSSTAKIICEKCHVLRTSSGTWSNNAHKDHDDRGREGAFCNQCHVAVPHGWGRPRLLGYTTDPAPYRTWVGTSGNKDGGLARITLKNYTPNSWGKSDCGAGCSSSRHPLSGTSWPNVMSSTPPGASTGAISGTVTNVSTGSAVSGATVSAGTHTTTTSGNGSYSLTAIPQGTYTMTVNATGYQPHTQSVSVTVGGVTNVNVALVPESSSGGNLALGRSFAASRFINSTYHPSLAGDDRLDTYWWSQSNGGRDQTDWLRVDLGSRYRVNKVEIAWFGDLWALEYQVYTSTDGSSWREVYKTDKGTAGLQTVTFSARDARYVRVECRKTGTRLNNGYGIAEMRVFR